MKRLFDFIVAGGLLILLAPLLLTIMLLVRLVLGRPIFFVQTRPGWHSKPFALIKFRTMREAYDTKGSSLPDEERMTKFGQFLRLTSLDELPELVNVLKGEMSLVGPRPLLMEYLPLYSPEQARRHAVRPGITGWAQVNGRNLLEWEEKFDLDLCYIDHWSFWLDLKILCLTLINVVLRKGVNQAGHTTAAPFRGNRRIQA